MSTHAHAETAADHDTNAAVQIGWMALLVPFVLVLAAVLAFGTRTPGQIASTFLLLLIPLGVLAMRRGARRSAAWAPPKR
ncbi:MAG: hypothetical protein KF773_29550 [Deltaproteobacteria bacterium]|nr:hypothetical protein [Deltaproteobacteria bacterium]MCW5807374.1 hypothetical protein [Deltaproteobacteria bacterium]